MQIEKNSASVLFIVGLTAQVLKILFTAVFMNDKTEYILGKTNMFLDCNKFVLGNLCLKENYCKIPD